ncbi:MAG: hypothetical protein JSV18_06175 [Candidatus Bathyarchaeota archaeon]|nr:MAG: hypothetical protein JSV18_06175 [Candidatus Bathyarchaeota archaeon]
MGKSRSRTEKFERVTPRKEDPLAGLYQLEVEESRPMDREALLLLARMLDNLEDFNELSLGLRSIMVEDEVLETRILSLFKTLIQGVRNEHKYLRMDTLT